MAGDPGPPLTRAVIYVRQSLDATGEAAGVARQQQACEQLCAARGWTVVQVCADNSVSAYSGRPRPAWEETLRLARARTVDVIVAWHVDRLTRSLRDLEHLIVLAEETGVRVVTASGDLDLTTDSGRLVARILASVARAEGERKAARQRLANTQAAAAGRPAPGPRPIGYRREGGTYVVVEDEATAIKAGAEAVLAGMTLASVASAWNDAGLRTSQGGRAWSADSVRKALLSPRNVGHRSHRGHLAAEGAWPAILSPETHAALQALLRDPARRRGGGGAAGTLLTGIALCAVCERGVNGSRAGGRLAYRCRWGSHVVVNRDVVDDWVTGLVLERLAQRDVAQLLDDGPAGADLHAEATALRARLEVLAGAYADGTITETQLRTGTARLRAQLVDVDEQLASAGRVDALFHFTGQVDVGVVWAGLTLPQQRGVVDALCSVRLRPAGRGAKGWTPDLVDFAWRA